MRRFIAVLLAGTSVCLAGMHPVRAADMALSPVSAPYVPTPPPFSWTGFYLGANVGAGFGTTETSVDVGPALTALSGVPIAATAPLVSETFNGFIGGIQAGYNWQLGIVVLGVEGDLDAAGLQGTAPCALVLNCTMKHNWFADITGRVGVVTVDRALIYLKGGVAWGDQILPSATASTLRAPHWRQMQAGAARKPADC
jgi:outer membrane immunogenic protein